MIRFAGRTLIASIACALMACGPAPGRPSKEILKDIDAVQFSRVRSEAEAAAARKVALIDELYEAEPGNDRIPELMAEKWDMQMVLGKEREARKQIAEVLKSSTNKALKVEARWINLLTTLQQGSKDPKTVTAAAEEFIKSAPKDERGPAALYQIAVTANDTAAMKAVADRIFRDFPESRVAKILKTERRQIEGLGEPFALEFTDAISGATISMKDFKGKVVVVDFWATWCGPCVAEMPHMKTLYAKYKDKGVAFLGVSLDQPKEDGGLDALKNFVEKRNIPWPQYYQGNFWESEFSKGWGVNAIPCIFVVDADGNLYSTKGVGNLDTILPKLLKKAETAPASGGR